MEVSSVVVLCIFFLLLHCITISFFCHSKIILSSGGKSTRSSLGSTLAFFLFLLSECVISQPDEASAIMIFLEISDSSAVSLLSHYNLNNLTMMNSHETFFFVIGGTDLQWYFIHKNCNGQLWHLLELAINS